MPPYPKGKIRRPSHATIVAYLALFVALGGTGAYAANTVFSTDIVDGEVKAADIGVGQVLGSRITDETIHSEDVGPNRLTGADIDETKLRVAQGPGTRVLAGRMTIAPDENKVLFTIPGLGEVRGECAPTSGSVFWVNTTQTVVESWSERESGGIDFAQVTSPGGIRIFGGTAHFSGERHYTELSLGRGTSPGAHRMATIHGFISQGGGGQPCSVQASGVYWDTSS